MSDETWTIEQAIESARWASQDVYAHEKADAALAELVALRAERDALRAECDAWAGAVAEVARHYPEDIWPTPKSDGTSSGDCYAAEGARIACRNVVRIMDEWREEQAALGGAKEGT